MTEPNEAAFARSLTETKDGFTDRSQEGLSKREYFAIKIMAATISRTDYADYKAIAEESIKAVDALIEELNKKQTT